MHAHASALNRHLRNRPAIAVVVVLLLVAGMAWWLWHGTRFRSWDEDVKLSDGRTLVLHRQHEYLGGDNIRNTTLTFSLPELGGTRTWQQWMVPVIVDVHDGVVYIVGSTRSNVHFKAYVSPRYQLVAYRWDGDDFVRIPFLTVPARIRERENILWCSLGREHSTARAKAAGWCDDSGEYRAGQDNRIDLAKQARLAMEKVLKNGYKVPGTE